MGVEWEQGFFAADLATAGTEELLLDVDRVLRKFGVVESVDRIATFDMDEATSHDSIRDATEIGFRNAAVRYERLSSTAIGEQLHNKRTLRRPTEHYATITLLLGSDYHLYNACLLYTSPSPRDRTRSRMPSSA